MGDWNLNLKTDLMTDRASFLRALGNDLSKRSREFQQSTGQLAASVREYCARPTPEALDQAQQSWKETMYRWEHFELFQVGPLAEGGKVLKYNIYAWPGQAHFCRIDEEALKASKDVNYKLPSNPNRKGLQALEYLLFDQVLESHCPLGNGVAIEWNAQAPEQKWASRCAYLDRLVVDLDLQSTQLVQAWGDADANAMTQLIGHAEQEESMMQALYESLFYVDLELKNKKIAAPAGLDPKHCPSSPEPCLDRQEFPFANFSRQGIEANVLALIDVVFGPPLGERQGGLSGLIRAKGRDDVADRTEASLIELANLIQTDPSSSLPDLIQNQNQENCEITSLSWVCRLRVALKSLASDLKREYASILDLQIPDASDGDND